jgi:hypothetical protein
MYCSIPIAWVDKDDRWVPWEMDELGNSTRPHKCTKSPYMSKGAKRQRCTEYIKAHPEITEGIRTKVAAKSLDKEFSISLNREEST